MKIDKVVPKTPDIVLTLTAKEARALYNIVADFDTADSEAPYMVDGERFDVTLHSAMLKAGLRNE